MLDLGCANGIICENNKRESESWVGVDFSYGMVKAAKKKGIYNEVYEHNLSYGLPKELLEGNIQYNQVIALGCLEFIDGHKSLFKEIKNALIPEGRFFLTVEVEKENSSRLAINVKKTLYSEKRIEN